jgi:putrescine transport system substrate-binding protein
MGMHAMRFSIRFVCTAVMLGMMGFNQTVHAEEEKVLNVYNWSEYIAEDTVKKFEAETGIQVRYDNFDSNEILLAKMIAGRSGYDIVVPSSDFGRIMIDGGLMQKLDKPTLTNWGNLDPNILHMMSRLDPGNAYMAPWLGSSITVGYNLDKVKAALGETPIPANPFDLVFNPAYAAKLSHCGISMLDSASDIFPSALIYLGTNPYSRDAGDYSAAAAMLQKVRPFIGLFSSLGYNTDLANGNLCVAIGYSGDFNKARARAAESKNPVTIVTPLPPAGIQAGFESMMIPADAPHPQNAAKWINYILRPEVQAAITNKVMYTSPNLAARKFIRKEVLENPITFPPEDYMKSKMYFYEPRSSDTRRVMTRLFTRIKTGM